MSALPPSAAHRATRFGGALDAAIEQRPDGSHVLRSTEPLGEHPQRITDRLERWAALAPDRTLVARRVRAKDGKSGDWERISYAQMLDRARRIGQALLNSGLSVDRPLAILSDNDLEHISLAFGALWAGVPYAPISAAYSLVSQDHAKLRHIVGKLTPGLLFASDPAYARAIDAVATKEMQVVLGEGSLPGRESTPFAALLDSEPGASLDAAHAAIGPDTIAKFLFTSGSTKQPKGVINTHRMLCANQQMLRQTLAFVIDEPPVLVDWLPWNHTFGGNHNIGLALYNGGTLYIDEGKPTAKGIAETLRNLREISPTVYFNVPKGYEEIAAAMEEDAALRESMFKRVQAFMFAGAGLSQAVWDQLDRLAVRTVGHKVPVITSLGMTETAPACTFAVRPAELRAGHVGLPCPGVEVKLVVHGSGPGAKTEVRFRGPNVMPGYWRDPELSADAFDEEGYYRTGDAVRWVDPQDMGKGLLFDGRIAEDFKLDTGTFVSVGPLRAKVIAEGSPCVQDVVVTGLNRSEIGLLLFPRLDECRKLGGLPADASAHTILTAPAVQAFFQDVIDRLWRSGTGSANRVARACVLSDPPAIDQGEVTDKGSLNQRAVLAHRAALVEAMYGGRAGDNAVLVLPQRS